MSRLLLIAILAGSAVALFYLFVLRFEVGDSFPAYSSLRADPLGCKALYESLEDVSGTRVSRNYRQLSKAELEPDSALFVLGARATSFFRATPDWVHPVEQFVRSGGRLVVAFYPTWTETDPIHDTVQKAMETSSAGSEESASETEEPSKDEAGEPLEEGSPPSPVPGPDEPTETSTVGDEEQTTSAARVNLRDRWELNHRISNFDPDIALEKAWLADPTGKLGEGGLEPSLTWRSGIELEGLASSWRVVYTRQGKPVVLERSLGQGTIVVASSSFIMSNEALWQERSAGFLAWLVGQHREVVFDEFHLGVRADPGVVALARRYRLHGLAAGLLVLALLFVWRNSSPLVQEAEETFGHDLPGASARYRVAGAGDSMAGLVGILQRSIGPRDLLRCCVKEWLATTRYARSSVASIPSEAPDEARAPRDSGDPEARLLEVARSVSRARRGAREAEVVSAYRKMCKILVKKE